MSVVKKKINLVLPEISVALFAVLIYAPFWVLYFSGEDFIYGWPALAVLAGLCLAALILPALIPLPDKAVKILKGGFSCLVLYLLISITFLPFDTGLMDGSEEPGLMISEGIMHLGLLYLCLFAVIRFQALTLRLTRALSLVALGLAGFFIFSTDVNDDFSLFRAGRNAILEYGTKENVLIIVNDSFQGAFIKDAFETDPTLRDIFDGFEYFPNAVANGPHTTVSSRCILTGRVEKNESGVINEIDQTDNLLTDALKAGYEVANLTVSEIVVEGVPNIGTGYQNLFKPRFESVRDLIFTSARRYCYEPFLSRVVYPLEFGWISKMDVKQQYDHFVSHPHVGPADKKLIYYHNLIPHVPVRFDAQGNFDRSLGLADYKGEIILSFTQLATLFQNLKDIGVYDQTAIFIVADHGHYSFRRNWNWYDKKFDYLTRPIGDNVLAQYDIAFLVKRRNARGPMKMISSPVAMTDLRKTVNGLIGGPSYDRLDQTLDILNEPIPDHRSIPIFAFYYADNPKGQNNFYHTLRGRGIKESQYLYSFHGWRIDELEVPVQ